MSVRVSTVDPTTVLRDEAEAMRVYDHDRIIAFDIETTGLHHARDTIAVVAFHAEGRPPAVLHYPDGLPYDSPIVDWLEDRTLVGHNLTAFDVPFLIQAGYDPFLADGWFDTMVAEQMSLSKDRGKVSVALASTLKRHLGLTIDKSIDHSGWRRPQLTEDQIRYAANDIVHVLRLREKQLQKIEDVGTMDGMETELDCAAITANFIAHGMPISDDRRREMVTKSLDDAAALQFDLEETFGDGFNPRSASQVKARFADVFGVTLRKTDEDTLTNVMAEGGPAGEAASLILMARRLLKRGMYDEDWAAKFVTNGRVHARYWSLGTDTGRYSSSDPNLQQVPRDYRPMFEAPGDNVLISVDYSGIEVLISGIRAREMGIVNAFREGRDVHRWVASQLFSLPEEKIDKDLRTVAKAASFTLLFGGGVPSLMRTAAQGGHPISRERAKTIINEFFDQFPAANAMVQRAYDRADGPYPVILKVPHGVRRVLVPPDKSAQRILNTLCQGTAAVGLKKGLAAMKEYGIARMVRAVVHDEVVLECPASDADAVIHAATRAMKEGMASVIGMEPGTEYKVGKNWS